MIGRQVRFYLHPDDRTAVDSFVRGELKSALLTERASGVRAFEVGDSRESRMKMLITPVSLLSQLRPHYIASRDEWILNSDSEPVIEWRFSKLVDDVIYPGRFYYIPAVLISDSRNEKPIEFLEAATQLFKWIRKETQTVKMEWGSVRLGSVAAEMLRSGDLTLQRNPV